MPDPLDRHQQLQAYLRQGQGQFRFEEDLFRNQFPLLERLLIGAETPMPSRVEIHPSGRCNNNCRWCRGASGQRIPDFPPSMLSQEVLFSLIDDLHAAGVSGLLFDGYYGEPLLNPATLPAMARAIACGMQVALGTNGRLLGRHAQAIAVAASYVRVSLDTANNESHHLLKGTRGRPVDAVFRNLAGLVERKQQCRAAVRVGISYILQPENLHEIPRLAQRAAAIGVDHIQFKLAMGDPRGRLTVEQVHMAHDHIEAVRTRLPADGPQLLAMQSRADALREISAVGRLEVKMCIAPELMPVVGPEGNVYPCCEHTDRPMERFGSIHDARFEDIWRGPQRRQVMAAIDPRSTCSVCSRYNARINRFFAFLETGYAEDPSFLNGLREARLSLEDAGRGNAE